MEKRKGLRQRILAAGTEEEVERLVALGRTFDWPRQATQSRWNVAAERRIGEIRGIVVPKVRAEANNAEAERAVAEHERDGRKAKAGRRG